MLKRPKKIIRCYLAGWFTPFRGWDDCRDFVKDQKDQIEGELSFYDPRLDTKQGSIATFVYQDLVNGVDSCDMVFYFVTSSGDVGSAIECERAECEGKLVVLCINEGVRVVHLLVLSYYFEVLCLITTN